MAVYIDDLNQKFGSMLLCHMIADNEEELHQMADTLDVNRDWFRTDHYLVPTSRKESAIQAGVVEITFRQCACMNMRRRECGILGMPNDAENWARSFLAQKVRLNRMVAAARFDIPTPSSTGTD